MVSMLPARLGAVDDVMAALDLVSTGSGEVARVAPKPK
jgi:hypothetical protein